jgi:hypothetical protein
MYIEYNSPLDNVSPRQIFNFFQKIIDANIVEKEFEKQLLSAWISETPKINKLNKADFISRIVVSDSHKQESQNQDCPICKKIVQLYCK